MSQALPQLLPYLHSAALAMSLLLVACTGAPAAALTPTPQAQAGCANRCLR